MIDIQQLIEADKELLLTLNGSSSLFWDGFMWTVSGTKIWIPVGAMLLYIIFKNTKFTQGLLILVMLVLTVTLADQFSSGLCKPLFMRFRPAQDGNNVYGECREWLQGRNIWIYIKPCCQYICCSYLCSFAHT